MRISAQGTKMQVGDWLYDRSDGKVPLLGVYNSDEDRICIAFDGNDPPSWEIIQLTIAHEMGHRQLGHGRSWNFWPLLEETDAWKLAIAAYGIPSPEGLRFIADCLDTYISKEINGSRP